MKPKVPCQNCEKRHLSCHSKCDAYKAYKQELDKLNEQVRKEFEEDSFYNEVRSKVSKDYRRKKGTQK